MADEKKQETKKPEAGKPQLPLVKLYLKMLAKRLENAHKTD